VEIQESTLSFAEAADVDYSLSFDTHPRERWPVSDRRYDQLAGVLEADEPAIKQVIDAGREQQSVLAVEPLLVR
jgi:hypothetical protein